MPSSSTSASSSSSEWIDLYIAIYPEGAAYKHWALFVNDSAKRLILHAQGSAANFRFEELQKDPRKSTRHPELVKVTRIHQDNIWYLRRYARDLPLNCGHGWNCQDYVIELIQKAMAEDIIEVTAAKMQQVKGMIEGLT